MAAEEKDNEEQEDVLALTAVEVPAASRGNEEADAETDAELPPVENGRTGGRTAVEIAEEQPGLAAEAAAEISPDDGPVWTIRAVEPGMEAAQELAAAERMEQAAEALEKARGGGSSAGWTAAEAVWKSAAEAAFAETRQTVQAGLEGLYRQTVRGLQPAAPALLPEQAGRTVRAQEPGSAASLAVDELDRAVRRDSRRYDGGMSIF